ncbi:MAG: membrane dipeptidase [Candidatus Thermoplasmatota archaeon]|nr:membrane dipeptidase [Candidatus Thermoplasmatota archaeon]MCL5789576.1 membrane dipeptidase [Candidatus Thermoplasmatota archaeon]
MKLIDLHEDMGVTSQRADIISSTEQSNLREISRFEDAVIFGVCFPHISVVNDRAEELSKQYGHPARSTVPLWDDLMEQLKFYKYLERKGLVSIVKNHSDIMKQGTKLLLSLEGTDCLRDPFDLYLLHDLGLRAVGLTWNYDTKFAAAAMSRKDYGLTGSGVELIEIANSNNMIVDVAHASRNTIIDTCSLSRKPVISSHGNAKGVFNHVRNLDDESIGAIVKTGGVVGITGIMSTLGKEPSIDDMVKHMLYVGDNFGWDHVALGTDFLGIDDTPRGFESISKVKDLAEKLGDRADQVMWQNPLRVISQVLHE